MKAVELCYVPAVASCLLIGIYLHKTMAPLSLSSITRNPGVTQASRSNIRNARIFMNMSNKNNSHSNVLKALTENMFNQNTHLSSSWKKYLDHPLYYPGDQLPTYEERRLSDEQLPRRLDLKLEKSLNIVNLVMELPSPCFMACCWDPTFSTLSYPGMMIWITPGSQLPEIQHVY